MEFIDGEILNDFESFKSDIVPIKSQKQKLKVNSQAITINEFTPTFLSKDERNKFALEAERRKELENSKKEMEIRQHKKDYIQSKHQEKDDYYKKPRKVKNRSRSRSNEYHNKHKKNKNVSNLEDKEVEAIKSYYLGLNKEKRRIIKPSEKFKNIFNFEWDYSEDTSNDINPIYKNKRDPLLLFGRGIRGGFDIKEQKKQSKEYEKLLENDKSDSNDGKQDRNKEKKNRRERSRNKSRSNSEKRRAYYEKSQEKENIHWGKKDAAEMTERDWRIFREDNDIILKGGRVPHPMRSWDEGNLPDFIIAAIKEVGYKMPSPIQMQGIPIGLERRDMIGLAPTGSGKSAAFLIPLIVYLNTLPPVNPSNANEGPYAIIIVPSRELGLQIFDEFNKFSKFTKLKAACIVGGRSSEDQAFHLGMGVELIIGTPGRIQDCLERHYTTLNQCHYVILDEADKMIKEDFEPALNFILDCIPETNLKSEDEKVVEEQEKEFKLGNQRFRITMMFSATMSTQLEKLARKYLRCPSYISIGEPGVGKKEIEQHIEFLQDGQKKERLLKVVEKYKHHIMIFVNQKKNADYLCRTLDRYGLKATTLHGGKTQDMREKALNGFKNEKYDILVCTNVAARGIDIEGVSLVINYDCPDSIEDYNHRIGRTGRAEAKGTAITFLTNADEGIFYDLKEYLEYNKQQIPVELAQHPASKIKPGSYKDNAPRRKQVLYTA